MKFKFKKISNYFWRQSEIDDNAVDKLRDMLLEVREMNKQLNVSPEVERWTYKIIINNFIKNYDHYPVSPQKALIQRLFSLFRKKKNPELIRMEEVLTKRIKKNPS